MKKTILIAILLTLSFLSKAQVVNLPPWSPQEKAITLNAIMKSRDIYKIKPVSYKDSLCQCYLRGLMKRLPKGIPYFTIKIQKIVEDSCKKVVKKPK